MNPHLGPHDHDGPQAPDDPSGNDPTLRFRADDPGGVILDRIQFSAWSALLQWIAGREDLMQAFWRSVGQPVPQSPRTALDAAIDRATGYDPKAAVAAHFPAFVRWVTREYWGEDEITPSIQASLDRLPV